MKPRKPIDPADNWCWRVNRVAPGGERIDSSVPPPVALRRALSLALQFRTRREHLLADGSIRRSTFSATLILWMRTQTRCQQTSSTNCFRVIRTRAILQRPRVSPRRCAAGTLAAVIRRSASRSPTVPRAPLIDGTCKGLQVPERTIAVAMGCGAGSALSSSANKPLERTKSRMHQARNG